MKRVHFVFDSDLFTERANRRAEDLPTGNKLWSGLHSQLHTGCQMCPNACTCCRASRHPDVHPLQFPLQSAQRAQVKSALSVLKCWSAGGIRTHEWRFCSAFVLFWPISFQQVSSAGSGAIRSVWACLGAIVQRIVQRGR